MEISICLSGGVQSACICERNRIILSAGVLDRAVVLSSKIFVDVIIFLLVILSLLPLNTQKHLTLAFSNILLSQKSIIYMCICMNECA